MPKHILSKAKLTLLTEKENITEAVRVLKQGGVVAFPTATCYGFAVDATNLQAVKRLYYLKGRAFKNPVHVMVPSISRAAKITTFGAHAQKLAKTYWPGPLTLVLPIKSKLPSFKLLSAGTNSLGIRVPDHPLAQQLVKKFNKPITATSANLSGQNANYSVQQIQKQYKHSKIKPNFYLGAGMLKRNAPSTVVSLQRMHATLIREGAIKFAQIKRKLS